MRHQKMKQYAKLLPEVRESLDELAAKGNDPYSNIDNNDGQLACFLISAYNKLRNVGLSYCKANELILHAAQGYIQHLDENIRAYMADPGPYEKSRPNSFYKQWRSSEIQDQFFVEVTQLRKQAKAEKRRLTLVNAIKAIVSGSPLYGYQSLKDKDLKDGDLKSLIDRYNRIAKRKKQEAASRQSIIKALDE